MADLTPGKLVDAKFGVRIGWASMFL